MLFCQTMLRYLQRLTELAARLVAGTDQDHHGQDSVPGSLTGVIQVSAGLWESCALKSTGTVVCWGTPGWTHPPRGLSGVAQLAMGRYDGCAVKRTGAVTCWGRLTQYRRH